MTKTWIVVAHDAGARVFGNQGPGTGLDLLEEIEHPLGRARDREINTDRPGRSFRKDSGDPRRAAMSRSESPHEHAVAGFARDLAGRLQQGRVQNEFARLVLVAPPRFLGLLRQSLDAPTADLVVGSINKDLARADEAELIVQIGEVVAV
jgi:protein required for attachment to host cells